jgi:hypothetical protein
MYSVMDYGPLNLFSAALLATDVSAIYYNRTALYIAKSLRLLYPPLNASLSLSLLLSRKAVGLYGGWIALRFLCSMLWFCSCLFECVWWKEPEAETARITLPGVNFDDSSSCSATSDDCSEEE